jgi:cullin-associated NEDD8-dissociated protein 1
VKQNYLSVGRCVSALVLNTTQAADATATVKRFISDVTSGSEQSKLIALYCLGDIGRKSDLSTYAGLRDVLTKLLDFENEEIRAAASYALGSIAVGNLAAFLPSLLADIQSSKRQYLLLHSIREIIADAPAAALQPHLDVIAALLLENSKSEDDGTRNVVAECLGKLAPVNPKVLIPMLEARVTDANADTRATIVSSFKFAVVEHADPALEEALAAATDSILNCLIDAQVEVRRAALRTINFIIHNNPSLVRHKLGKYLPALYAQTAIKKELIREVDLGPFKHRVDDGLDTRKAAFECMYTLLERLPGVVAVADFVHPLVSGMDDEQEIKLQAYLIIVRLALVTGTSLLEVLDQLLEPVKKEIKKKVDKSAIAQAQERQLELKRSALRAVAAIASIQGCDLKDTLECVNAAGLKEQYDSVLADMVTAGDLLT